MSARTPGPWLVQGEPVRYQNGDVGAYITTVTRGVVPISHYVASNVRTADAAFIVHACNAHDDLVAALRDILGASTCDDAESALADIQVTVRAALARVQS
jgi:hypothetical protein